MVILRMIGQAACLEEQSVQLHKWVMGKGMRVSGSQYRMRQQQWQEEVWRVGARMMILRMIGQAACLEEQSVQLHRLQQQQLAQLPRHISHQCQVPFSSRCCSAC